MPADDPLKHVHRRRLGAEIGLGIEAPDGAGQFAARAADTGVEFLDHLVLEQEFWMRRCNVRSEATQDLAAHRSVRQADFNRRCALNLAAQARAEANRLAGRCIADQHDLTSIAGNFADVLIELRLGAGTPGDPVQVIHDQDRRRPQAPLQSARVARLHAIEIGRHEFLGRQIHNLAVRITARCLILQRHPDMRLAGALRTIDQSDWRTGRKACRDPLGNLCRDLVRRTDDEVCKRHRGPTAGSGGYRLNLLRICVTGIRPRIADQVTQIIRRIAPADQLDRPALRIKARPQALDLALEARFNAVQRNAVFGCKQQLVLDLGDKAQVRNPAVEVFRRDTGLKYGLHFFPNALTSGFAALLFLTLFGYARVKQSFSVHHRPRF